ncbi:expressed unknown protein [Seminavis robusta]|uniref:Uncharacterized protein n=1 Tax=Seminavis robusta TaxID=568900 RepID=A0A9N8ERH0_9STRA|nr:expressed unknown protein [Seminavis robusta]|eukprot:Sro1738_g294520.1 n/a (480) ;mRNA; r:10899-12454
MAPLGLQSLVLVAATLTSLVSGRKQHQNAVPPSTGKDWISLHNKQGVEFQPAPAAKGTTPQQQRALRQAQKRLLQEESEESSESQQVLSYVDSAETYYDAYAQAWRYVGFYTDCNPAQEDRRRHRRKLNDEEEDPCQRYLLWAAYVDLGYTGLGIGEYQFWDTYAETWDTSACEKVGNVNEDGEIDETTCKRMNCHMPEGSKNWHLMGYYKEVEYTEWFEQLFKHEGYCVWQGNEYNFMYNNYGAWPEGCSETETYLKDGTALYYDTKALPNATMTYGLYTDARCSVDYEGDEVTMEQVLLNGDGDGDLLSVEYLDYWNEAMEIYRVCQPCRAYALNQGYGGDDGRRRRQLAEGKQRRLEDNDPNNGLFQCDDAAGYTNVNQCMKFRTKTDMEYASLEEVMEATLQGGVTSVTVDRRTYGSYRAGRTEVEIVPDWNLMWIACAVLGVGLASLLGAIAWTTTRCRALKGNNLKEPLITEL